jgi:flagellin
MLAIKNNVMSQNAARHLGQSYDSLAKSVERLSSGLRINSSKDDAAGLAVRALMRADIATLQQGARNASDAISMLQTMEGAMATVDDVLIRMKELAEQAATGSYSQTQRIIMNAEFQEMADEIDRIATSTDFNGITMLNSATGSTQIHIGSTTTLEIGMVSMTRDNLGLGTTAAPDVDILGLNSAVDALTVIADAISSKNDARATFGYKMNRLENSNAVLNIQAENLIAAESRISDVDVATEMAKMTRNQVLAQAGVAMLAQANTIPQMALQLLRG